MCQRPKTIETPRGGKFSGQIRPPHPATSGSHSYLLKQGPMYGIFKVVGYDLQYKLGKGTSCSNLGYPYIGPCLSRQE